MNGRKPGRRCVGSGASTEDHTMGIIGAIITLIIIIFILQLIF